MTRAAAEIGAGLAPARDARPIPSGERIHVIGAGGAGASAAALLARAAGAIVSGCDSGGPSQYTPALDAAGIALEWGHDPEHVADPATGAARADRLAVTKALTAIDPGHPELAAAAALSVPREPWQQVVADAAAGRRLVAVAGTHGKSTTAGWLAWVLAEAGHDPGAFVGALLPSALTGGPPATARRGRGVAFVVEADEYAGNFDAYRPDLVVLTNVEWDHPDVFADLDATVSAFAAWLERAPDAGLVVNAADAGVRRLLARLDRRGRLVRTSVVDGGAPDPGVGAVELFGSIIAAEPAGTRVGVRGLGPGRITIGLPTAGAHNVANALVVAGAARELGVAPDAIAAGLASFPGVGRRLERKGEVAGVVVYDDYGHHPTAIRATIAAVRQREPGRRVWAVYEPLTFHRTAALLDEFAAALAEGDAVAVADIWAGRDPDTSVASPGRLARAVRDRRPGVVAEAPGPVEATARWLAGHVEPGDAVLVMGGGRSYRIGEILLETLGGLAPAG